MIGSDLYKPLPARSARQAPRVPRGLAAAAVSALILGVVGIVVLRDDGNRGEPLAVGSIGVKPPAAAGALSLPSLAAPIAPAAAPTAVATPSTTQRAEIENGVMVIRATAPGATGPTTIKVPDPTPDAAAYKAPDPQLIEATAIGPLPRVGRDGRRPATAYAASPVAIQGKPRIAVLIGGMGLDPAATKLANGALPASVTFGYAPYGTSLADQVAQTREAGHEVVLQMPMEDFGGRDPSFPHMLKVDDTDNTQRLRWLMSRFAGYAGVGNYLGGRLLADEGSLKPVLQDIAARGLYFIDDGTAPRSLAGPLSQDLGLPSRKADVVIDAHDDAASIEAALARLERLARERGFALGTAAGRPATNALIGRFLAEAAKRGLVLVPVSQALGLIGNTGSADAGR